jgi:hypothetical protein
MSEPDGLQVAGSSVGAVPAPEAVAAIAAHVTITQRFSISNSLQFTISIAHERQINSPAPDALDPGFR